MRMFNFEVQHTPVRLRPRATAESSAAFGFGMTRSLEWARFPAAFRFGSLLLPEFSVDDLRSTVGALTTAVFVSNGG